MDQSKKTMRHFYCRDVLWETFEQMANDFDCSIDYLVNEAMRYYARSKNYQSPGAPGMTGAAPVAGNSGATAYPMKGGPGGGAAGGARTMSSTQPPPQPMGPNTAGPTASPGSNRGRGAPPTPGYSRGAGGGGTPAMAAGGGMGMAHAGAAQPSNNHPPQPAMPQMGAAGPTLFLIYNGQRYPVTKDQFIIGRGSKTSDLAIKDGNISRKHAAVIRRNGTFYIKDLGSTNGIDYKGMRIDNKRIDEGDVFHLCDYELRFTYRAD
ncbi:MAG TPA: FHA domain-containing protein [Kofleriaceae bacterium]|nr:FHA domain-containing protein [Kofleriaceae bacterium]